MNRLFLSHWRMLFFVVLLFGLFGFWKHSSTQASPLLPPIAVVINDSAPTPFGRYLGEILRAEGLNSYDFLNLNTATLNELNQYSLVILAETPLTTDQVTLFTNFVNGGGRVMAMRPASQIASLFGLTNPAGVQANGYVRFESAAAFQSTFPAAGLTSQTLQIHGDTDRYNLAPGAIELASLYSNANTATTYPAIVSSATGQAVAFTYDLPRNVIHMRQGNPANADVDSDGDGVLRTIDLFQSSGGGEPWINRDRITVPQADEQQRFFARLVRAMLNQPIPQLWYFPGQAKTMLILTGDAHANPVGWYDLLLNSVDSYGGDITVYVSIGNPLSDAFMQTARGLGHEFGLHPYWNRPDSYLPYNVTNLDEGYQAIQLFWNNSGYSSPWSRTVRHHQVHWRGWTDAAATAVNYGMAMDTNFYHWGAWLQKPDGTWPHGYITGSGQPMKFSTADGTILPYYQQLTQLVDEQFFTAAGGVEALNPTQAIVVSQQLMDASQNGDYAAIMTQFHIDYYGFGDPQVWAEGTMGYAQSNGIPIWNADRWLTFTETRHDANYSNIIWDNGTGELTFDLVAAASPGYHLTTLLPLTYGGRTLQTVTVDNNPVSFSVQTIKGTDTAFVTVTAGNHSFQATYQTTIPTATPTAGPSPTPTNTPTPSNTPTIGPSPTSTNTATNTPTPGPTNTPNPGGFPSSSILDNFNRANGTLGSHWNGTTTGYAIASNRLDVGGGGDVYWSTSAFGADQEAFVTLTNLDLTATEVDLLLKGQSAAHWGNGVLEVWYDAANHRAQVWTFAPSQGWVQHGADIPVMLVNGDQFGAKAAATGQVSVYQNGNLVGTRDVSTWPFATEGGYIGLWFVDAANTLLDDFGGGNVGTLVTATPSDTPLPPTSTATATNTPLPPTPTATATAGPSATPSHTPTSTLPPSPTATLPPAPLTNTTLTDFGQSCTILTSTQVMEMGDGAVALAAAFSDNFSSSALDPFRWSAGAWSGGAYNPALSNDLLTIAGGAGAWVRSQTTYTRAVLETTASFGNGDWQHIGFASEGFAGDQYLIFSTMSGSGNLYARVNNGNGEQNLNLGAIPTGLHHYRIEWIAVNATTDRALFAVDGVQVAQFDVNNTALSNLYLYLSNNGAAALSVDSVQITPPYQGSGSYTGCTLDAGTGVVWNNISWAADVPPLTGLNAEIRTSADGLTWGDWMTLGNSSGSAFTPARYVTYRFGFTGNGLNTPILYSVTLNRADGTAPTPTNTPVLPTATATNTTEPPTATPTHTPQPPTPTPSSTPQPTATPVPPSLTHTTVADFGASCAGLEATQVRDAGDGAVALAAAFSDTFTSSTFDSLRWSAGTWAGGAYNPVLDNGLLTIPGGAGAWVRSQTVYTHAIMDVTAAFGNGAWQHIGFASDSFIGNLYFIFSTLAGDGNLYARVNNNGSEQALNLGPIPTGLHRYRIEWAAVNGTIDRVSFYRDGAFQAQFDVTSAGAANLYLYLSNNGAAALSVDSAAVFPSYQANGTYSSCILDAGTGHIWHSISWVADQPANTNLIAETRTSTDGVNWSEWTVAAANNGSSVTGQFLQYRFTFSSIDGLDSPLLHSVSLGRVNNTIP